MHGFKLVVMDTFFRQMEQKSFKECRGVARSKMWGGHAWWVWGLGVEPPVRSRVRS